jgi:hypothetical protein
MEKSDLAHDEAISILMKLGSDENLTSDCHGPFDLLMNIPHCIKHLTYPTETIQTFPNLRYLEDSSLCNLVSSVLESPPNLSQENEMRRNKRKGRRVEGNH